MKLISINIGHEQTLHNKDRVERTGIFKLPVDQPVNVTKLGLEKDVIVSKKHHGGPDQAIYIYGEPDYQWWSRELGRESWARHLRRKPDDQRPGKREVQYR